MSVQIFSLIVGIMFAVPFVIWFILRFRDKVKQKFAHWYKWAILGSFLGFFLTGTLLIILAITLKWF